MKRTAPSPNKPAIFPMPLAVQNLFRRIAFERFQAGEPPTAVIRELGVHRPTVYHWFKNYRERGLEGQLDQRTLRVRRHPPPSSRPLPLSLDDHNALRRKAFESFAWGWPCRRVSAQLGITPARAASLKRQFVKRGLDDWKDHRRTIPDAQRIAVPDLPISKLPIATRKTLRRLAYRRLDAGGTWKNLMDELCLPPWTARRWAADHRGARADPWDLSTSRRPS